MIKNARQFNRARKNLSGFVALKRRLIKILHDFELDDGELIAMIDYRICQLTDQLTEYQRADGAELEKLRADLSRVSAIPAALLKARIFLGWSQSEFALRTQLTRQQVHAYEKNAYNSMALGRFLIITEHMQQALSQYSLNNSKLSAERLQMKPLI